jgi:cytochrome c oxidase subunit 2
MLLNLFLLSDTAEPWQRSFQDAATELMFKIRLLRDQIMFYLVLILTILSWLILRLYFTFSSKKTLISHKFMLRGSLLETIWTIIPILILFLIAFPSFKLLYLTDQILNPQITLKILGRQWYWSYEYSDYLESDNESLTFDSYMIASNELELGSFRLMEVDNKIVLPIGTRIRVVISSGDVIHCWTIPAIGVKVDAVPGRLNQASFVLNREGLLYGACSEICGSERGFMPINLQSVSLNNYISWVHAQFSN